MVFQRNLPVLNSYKRKGHYQGQSNAKQTWMNNVIAKTQEKIAKEKQYV
jgi:hypothetical protein